MKINKTLPYVIVGALTLGVLTSGRTEAGPLLDRYNASDSGFSVSDMYDYAGNCKDEVCGRVNKMGKGLYTVVDSLVFRPVQDVAFASSGVLNSPCETAKNAYQGTKNKLHSICDDRSCCGKAKDFGEGVCKGVSTVTGYIGNRVGDAGIGSVNFVTGPLSRRPYETFSLIAE